MEGMKEKRRKEQRKKMEGMKEKRRKEQRKKMEGMKEKRRKEQRKKMEWMKEKRREKGIVNMNGSSWTVSEKMKSKLERMCGEEANLST